MKIRKISIYNIWCVAHVIIVSPQSQLDFGFFTSLGLGLAWV